MLAAQLVLDALGAGGGVGNEPAPPSQISNTVCITDDSQHVVGVTSDTVKLLGVYGEIARLDMSLAAVLKCILVTYFDVRCAQKALLDMAGHSEPFPDADHDFRTVFVSLAAFTAKVGVAGGFNQYGEVANISTHQGDALVEFYDMRAAQRLCAAAGGTASPCAPRHGPSVAWAPPGDFEGFGYGGFAPGSLLGHGAEAAAFHSFGFAEGASEERPAKPPRRSSDARLAAGRPAEATPTSDGDRSPMANRPLRTKISTKDFSKFDISPEKIRSGEDQRTTVMVRNLVGPRARKDFLEFLETGGLQDKFTFFYMPCKEHRDVRAGFAFVNFRSPEEVLKLWDMVQGGAWTSARGGDAQSRPLAMSYARFQGHDELMSHFSTSVVLHEQDPEKRPIFCGDASGGPRHSGGPAAAGTRRGGAAGEAPGLPVKLNLPGSPAKDKPAADEPKRAGAAVGDDGPVYLPAPLTWAPVAGAPGQKGEMADGGPAVDPASIGA